MNNREQYAEEMIERVVSMIDTSRPADFDLRIFAIVQDLFPAAEDYELARYVYLSACAELGNRIAREAGYENEAQMHYAERLMAEHVANPRRVVQ